MRRERVLLATPPVPGPRLAAALLDRRHDRCPGPGAGIDGGGTLTRYQNIPLAAPGEGGGRSYEGIRGTGGSPVGLRSLERDAGVADGPAPPQPPPAARLLLAATREKETRAVDGV
jgi:hypothetical protein